MGSLVLRPLEVENVGWRVSTRREHATRPRRESLRKRKPKLAALVMARDGGRCVYCPAPATTLDHLTPRSKGGLDIESNLVAACLSCNSARKDTDHEVWTARLAPRRISLLAGIRPAGMPRPPKPTGSRIRPPEYLGPVCVDKSRRAHAKRACKYTNEQVAEVGRLRAMGLSFAKVEAAMGWRSGGRPGTIAKQLWETRGNP